MMMPSIFGRDMFDDFFSFPFHSFQTGSAAKAELMKTDIRDTDQGYEITMDLPGIRKEDVKAELKDGYLTIQATTDSTNDEKNEDGHFIRRERHYGSCSRSFYVGDHVTQDEVKARFENGTLKMLIPKKEAHPTVEQQNYIAIEG